LRKKQRRGYRGSDVESDEDELQLEEVSLSESDEEEPPETNEKGRPIRRTAKKAITYEESDTDDDGKFASSSEEEQVTPVQKPKGKLIITLKTRATPAATPVAPVRSLRNRSGSYGGKHPPIISPSANSTKPSTVP
jgi:hypothetical protein